MVIGVAVVCAWSVYRGGRRAQSFSERFLSIFGTSNEDSRPSRSRRRHTYSKADFDSDDINEGDFNSDDNLELRNAMRNNSDVTRGSRDIPLIDEDSDWEASDTLRKIGGDNMRNKDIDRIRESQRSMKTKIEREGNDDASWLNDGNHAENQINGNFRSRRAMKFTRGRMNKNITNVERRSNERETKTSFVDEIALRARRTDRNFND